MIILKQTFRDVKLLKNFWAAQPFNAKLYLEGQCGKYTDSGETPLPPRLFSLSHTPTVPPQCSSGGTRSLPNAHLRLQQPWGHRVIWCFEEPVQGTMLSASPVLAPLAHVGTDSFQRVSPVLHPLRILPSCFFPSNRANHSFLMPLPHACIGNNWDPQRTLQSQKYLGLGLSSPDSSSGKKTSLTNRSPGGCNTIPLPFLLVPCVELVTILYINRFPFMSLKMG